MELVIVLCSISFIIGFTLGLIWQQWRMYKEVEEAAAYYRKMAKAYCKALSVNPIPYTVVLQGIGYNEVIHDQKLYP